MNDHFAKQLAVEAAGASMIPGEDTLRLLNENPATLEIMQLAGRL